MSLSNPDNLTIRVIYDRLDLVPCGVLVVLLVVSFLFPLVLLLILPSSI